MVTQYNEIFSSPKDAREKYQNDLSGSLYMQCENKEKSIMFAQENVR